MVGVLFAACAVVFGVFAWKRYQADRRDALLTADEKAALERNEDGA